eukprot:1744072-Rhodomonas_salina.5
MPLGTDMACGIISTGALCNFGAEATGFRSASCPYTRCVSPGTAMAYTLPMRAKHGARRAFNPRNMLCA